MTAARPRPPSPDRFDLYELCTQTPEIDVERLRVLHGGAPKILGEDFAGTAALSRAWTRRVRGGRAIAVDRDGEALARVRGVRGVNRVEADVLDVRARADVIVALNFSLNEWHERRDLVRYLRHVRRRLRRGGIFVADEYGGEGAFTIGRLSESHRARGGARVTYTFEQRAADALSGRVVDALHFEIEDVARRRARARPGRGAFLRLRDAFVYDWRLWSVPELRDALVEAGFASVEVYSRFEHAHDERGRLHVKPVASSRELGASFCVLMSGRR